MDYNQYLMDVFINFVAPGVVGGFAIFFAVYLISFAISLCIKLVFNN